MPGWRNGIREGLKILCPQGLVGPSPTPGTMNAADIKIPRDVKAYSEDGRPAIGELYAAYLELGNSPGFVVEKIYDRIYSEPEKTLPVIAVKTLEAGKSIWVISGIHGEEPAGPVAIARNIKIFIELAKKGIPLIVLPLCNPAGYARNWRYLFDKKNYDKGRSIGDSDHLIPDEKNSSMPHLPEPSNHDSEIFTEWIVKTASVYPPLIVIDLHEDDPETILDPTESLRFPHSTYVYSHGELGAGDPIAKEIVKILKKNNHKLAPDGAETRFGEKIVGGIISGAKDYSVDHLLSSREIFYKGKKIAGPSAKSVVVVETLTEGPGMSFENRIKTHGEILDSLERFWGMAGGQAIKP
ncbi:MAG: hypothetical protein CEN90_589 [Parcubacteria group bacterium Licking1014_17]|nr:MAG: hypothetical protein CEN90_589 [Parcubacteria group bacterium Licking1014_17]